MANQVKLTRVVLGYCMLSMAQKGVDLTRLVSTDAKGRGHLFSCDVERHAVPPTITVERARRAISVKIDFFLARVGVFFVQICLCRLVFLCVVMIVSTIICR